MGLNILGDKGVQVKAGATHVLIGKLIQKATGDLTPLHDSVEAVMQDPEIVGGIMLLYANLIANIAEHYNPGGLQSVVDWMIEEVSRD